MDTPETRICTGHYGQPCGHMASNHGALGCTACGCKHSEAFVKYQWAQCEILALRKRLEEAGRNHIERKHIDATPDDGYPLRILRVYRADCDMRWADTSDGDVGNPLTVALNEAQDKRAAILDRAIAALKEEMHG